MKKILLYLQGLSGFISVPRVCEFSKIWFDIHDYKKSKGGDGNPLHFACYTCWHCGKRFMI